MTMLYSNHSVTSCSIYLCVLLLINPIVFLVSKVVHTGLIDAPRKDRAKYFDTKKTSQ